MSALPIDIEPPEEPATKPKKPILVADLFCGAGGTSKGAKRALARLGRSMVLVAVNHWPVAVETHRRANPEARHYCQDIATLRPREAVPEGYLDLLMASPTCTHHSRARGGRPTSDQQRMDPWHVVTWCTELRVKRLLIENVPEFVDWGPVDRRTGKPVKSRKGEYFRAWIAALEAIGFKLEWRIANAADYGDATTRERFMLRGRSDGKRVRAPIATHAPADRGMLLGLAPWRPARDIINWKHKGRSIYGRPMPLKHKTLRRIESGLIKLGKAAAAPYLPRLRAEIERSMWYHTLAPKDRKAYRIAFKAAHSTGTAECVLSGQTFLVVLRGTGTARGVDAPVPAITASGNHLGIVELAAPVVPFVFPVNQSGDRARGVRSVDAPLPTLLTRDSLAVVEPGAPPFLLPQQGSADIRELGRPLPTIVTHGRPMLVEPGSPIEPFTLGQHSGSVARPVSQPLPTITAGGSQPCLVEPVPFIVPQFGERNGQLPRHHAIDAPLPAATSHGAGALVEPMLMQTDQFGSNGACVRSVDRPLATLVTKANVALIEPLDDGHDILFRMIQNGEIARATGFDDEEATYEFCGTQAEITKQIGNAVPVGMAAAHVYALMAE